MIGKKKLAGIAVGVTVALASAAAFAASQGAFASTAQTASPPAAAHSGHKGKHHQGRRHSVIPSKEIASYLKLTQKQLATDLHGHTLAQVATQQGITQSALTTELQSLFNARVQKAVKAGHMTQTKAAAAEKRVDQQLGAWVAQPHHWLGAGGHKQHKKSQGKRHSATARLLGQTAKDLKMTKKSLLTALHSGQTVAQVAAAHGMSATTLQQSLQTSAMKRVESALSHFLSRTWKAPKKG